MKSNQKDIRKFLVVVAFLLCFGWKIHLINASASVGAIDGTYHYAKGVENKNIKIDFGLFKGTINVVVTDTTVSGFAWGENIGWVNLSPSGGGVLNNGEGVLSGYATSEFGGWINFRPAGSGVSINSSGEFIGYALSEKFGRISFNCANDNSCATDNYKVKTDWRPVSVRGGHASSTEVIIPTAPPSETPPSNQNQTPSQNTGEKQKPLPIGNEGQYEAEGADIVKNYTPTGEIGQIIVIKPKENTGENQNSNGKNIPPTTQPETKTPSTSLEKKASAENKTENIIKEANLLTEKPAVNISTKTVSTVGVAGGGTALVTSVASEALSFSEFFLTFARLWSLLLSALGLRKRPQPWGTVFDSVTKQPLDPAYVILQNKKGEEVATSITDLDGRYGFIAPPGIYQLVAKKTNYIAPSLHLHGRERDEIYDNLYFGEDIEITTSKAITKNIPMDQQGFDWNEFAKKDKNLIQYHTPRKKLITRISNILFYVGLVLTIGLLIAKPDAFNIGALILYVLLSAFRFVNIRPKSYGVITERNTGFPLSYAVVRIFPKDSEKEAFHRVADQYGHYYCLLQKGEYYITIEKKNSDESYTKIYTSAPFFVKRKILNKDFRV